MEKNEPNSFADPDLKLYFPAWFCRCFESPPRLFGAFFLLLCVCDLPLLYLRDWPLRDVALRYAPMAEHFAAGNWQFAFHPRCQLLHTSVAGIFAFLLDCDGFSACRISAFFFFCLCIIPLFFLMRRIFGCKVAWC